MELTFPFKNLTYHNLLNLFEIGNIREYYEEEDRQKWIEESFNVQFYKDRIPSFENEILQIIETTNQETIDYYFTTLGQDIQYLKGLLNKEQLIEKIEARNEEELEKYNEAVSQKEKDFFASPLRKKKHLETYEQEPVYLPWQNGSIRFNAVKKTTYTNYNYYCIEEKLKFIDPTIVSEYLPFLEEQANLFIDTARKYGVPWTEGKVKAKEGERFRLNSILFCEGDIDIDLITRAGQILGKTELLSKFEIRQRGSCSNLDKLWSILIDNNWETVPQTKILLYDCDTNRPNEDFGHIYRRTIPKIEGHLVQRGIENLFPKETIQKAIAHKKEFVDFKNITGTVRGIAYEQSETVINKNEKRNFSNWIIENGTVEDFAHFEKIFAILENIISL